MTNPSLRLMWVVSFLATISLLALTCGKSNSPTTPDVPSDPQPNPDGVLLDGDAARNAMDAILTLPPSPAAEGDIDEGFITTRLQAIIHPDATVGDVNAVLTEHDLRIICMMAGVPMVTLKTLPLAGRAAADSLAELLTATAPFLYAAAAYVPGPEPVEYASMASTAAATVHPGLPASNNISHLQEMRMPAAWNMKSLVPSGRKVNVLVPDEYVQLTAHSEISAQRFVTGGTATSRVAGGQRVGNHGFHVCGILGADFDSVGSTGAHPDAQGYLDILSMPIGGYSWYDMQAGATFSIGTALPSGTFVLNTSLGYNDTGFVRIGKYERALNMLVWRMLVASKQSQFLHVSSAGNDGTSAGESGLAKWCSPFNSAAKFATIQDMLVGVTLTPDQQSTVDQLVALCQTNFPAALSPLTNVLTVGALISSGSPTAFSAREADVWAVGSVVYGPCASQDPGYSTLTPVMCSGTEAMYNGTSQAAPQVAGLAAYLWNIRPTLSVTQLKDIISRSKDGIQTNGYEAVLSLDQSLATATVRKAVLDVANGPSDSIPDSDFDEHDLKRFLDKFGEYETERQNSGSNDIDDSRYDLNGDGLTGGVFKTDFDLDVNNPPAFSSVSQQVCGSTRQFNELQVSDLEILTYYAFSSLYNGSLSIRDSLLGCQGATQYVLVAEIDSIVWVYSDARIYSLKVGVVSGSDTTFGDYNCTIKLTGAALAYTGIPGWQERDFTAFASGAVSLDFYLYRTSTQAELFFEVLDFGGSVLYDTTIIVQGDARTRWNGRYTGWANITGIECSPFDMSVNTAWMVLDLGFDGTRFNVFASYYTDSLYSHNLSPSYYGSGGGDVDPSATLNITCDMNFQSPFGTRPYYWNPEHGQINLQLDLNSCSISGSITPSVVCSTFTAPFGANFSALKGIRCQD